MKDFIIIGNQMCAIYNEIAPYFVNKQFRFGFSIHSNKREFMVSADYPLEGVAYRTDKEGNKYISMSNSRWITNLKVKSNWPFIVNEKYKYTPERYPFYDNYPAIDVNRISYIPADYYGEMGVPIGILDHYDEDKIDIIKMRYGNDNQFLSVNGKTPFVRIIIKRK